MIFFSTAEKHEQTRYYHPIEEKPCSRRQDIQKAFWINGNFQNSENAGKPNENKNKRQNGPLKLPFDNFLNKLRRNENQTDSLQEFQERELSRKNNKRKRKKKKKKRKERK